jgi:hypothetical protein
MMKPQFKGTPGPWAFAKSWSKGLYPKDFISIHSEGYNLNEDDYIGSNAGKTSICGIWGKLNDEIIANARLIAAAPELLEALQKTNELLKDLDNTHTGDSRYADFAIQYSENRKLIEKALEG